MVDCLIVGGGVIGLSLAYELAQHDLQVQVIDRGKMGREASWAGAGILPPANLQTAIHPFEKLRAMSHRLHRQWAERLREETAVDTGYRCCGGIYLARSAGEAASLLGLCDLYQEQQIEIEPLSPADLCRLEPALSPLAESGEVKAAFHLPGEAQLRNPDYLRALEIACRRRGVDIRENVEAQRFEIKGGRLKSVIAKNATFSADRYCITSGAWSQKLLSFLGIDNGIMPIRGQMILFACEKQLFSHILNEGPRYMVPRDDGHILVGSTEEEVGFDKNTTDEAISELTQLACSLVPALADAKQERCWAGLRPGTYDGFPYMGAVPGLENTFVAAGHFRSGLHMSPATAIVMSQLIRGQQPIIDLSPFRVGRG